MEYFPMMLENSKAYNVLANLVVLSRSSIGGGFDMVPRARLRHKRGQMPYTLNRFFINKEVKRGSDRTEWKEKAEIKQ